MHHPRAPHLDDEHERRRWEALELDHQKREALADRAERLADHASLPAWHPAAHRLARRERARRAATGGEGGV